MILPFLNGDSRGGVVRPTKLLLQSLWLIKVNGEGRGVQAYSQKKPVIRLSTTVAPLVLTSV